VGGGEKWTELRTLRNHGAPVAAFPYLPKDQVFALLGLADAGLVALEKPCVGLMSPSKIHGYLLCGRPLLYLGPPGSNVADAIEQYQCGWQVDEKDGMALARCLDALAADGAALRAASAGALRAAAERYSEVVAVRDLMEFVTH